MREETHSYRRVVIISVMPKGVEHADRICKNSKRSRVIISVMPKGVEHSLEALSRQAICFVTISVMPKGVEAYPRASLELKGRFFRRIISSCV